MERDIRKNLLGTDATLKDVMMTLDKSALGVVFIVADNGVMKGVLTDGDVRRALLRSASINDPVTSHMNRDFVYGSIDRSREENIALLNDRIRHLPILDEKGRPVDMISWADFWRLPVMEPVLGGNEFKYVADCIVTNWISSQGPYVDRFQERFCEYLPAKFALSVSNGTAALHLALVALGIGQGDEVIIPDLTFASPASMVLHCGATPVFVDVDRKTWTMVPAALRERITERTRAVIPVHLYGHPCDMDPILEIARRHDLLVIEDCAEALGAEYKGRKVGTMGDVGTFSFFANKVVTTGEGGMVTTENQELYEKMAILRDHGMARDKRYWHVCAGFNYRLTNLQAAIGVAQMEQIETFLSYRAETAAHYADRLGPIKGIILPPHEPWAKNIYWLYSIVVDETATGLDRDTLAARLAEHGIETRPFFHPLHKQPPFESVAEGDFPVTEWLAPRGLSLPTSNAIRLDDIDKVCTAVRSAVEHSSFVNEIGS